MPKLSFTPQELKDYFEGYKKSVLKESAEQLEESLRVHADGLYPKKVIEERRPHEDEQVKAYREKIWKPKTKGTFGRVINSLGKIRRSTDWSVSYTDDAPTRIPEGETLKDYCEKKFPYFTSVTNWAFSVLLREYLIDPNAVLIVMPVEIPSDLTQFIKPYGIIINSKFVIDYRNNDFAILENPLGAIYYDEKGNPHEGRSFYIYTTKQILIYDQSNARGDYQLSFVYNHNFDHMPAYKLGAVLVKAVENDFLYESRVQGMVYELDEAAREYSDLQASKVMHIYPERWEISTTECQSCKGTGKVKALLPTETPKPCPDCEGTGSKGASPYSKMRIKMGVLEQAAGVNVPIPPAGFVEKDTAIVKLMDESVQAHLRDALAAVNMEHLAEVPLTQSGVAKEVDRDEANNFFHSVAEDIVRIMDWFYAMVVRFRYGVQYATDNEQKTLLPDISVPEHFDIFSTTFLQEGIKNAKTNKINPILINQLETEYAEKQFNSSPEVADLIKLVLDLDPLANVDDDVKFTRLSNKGITQKDYVISSNILQFVKRAIFEDEGFPKLDYEQQRKKMEDFAQEVIDANDTAQALIDQASAALQMGQTGNPKEQVPSPSPNSSSGSSAASDTSFP